MTINFITQFRPLRIYRSPPPSKPVTKYEYIPSPLPCNFISRLRFNRVISLEKAGVLTDRNIIWFEALGEV